MLEKAGVPTAIKIFRSSLNTQVKVQFVNVKDAYIKVNAVKKPFWIKMNKKLSFYSVATKSWTQQQEEA